VFQKLPLKVELVDVLEIEVVGDARDSPPFEPTAMTAYVYEAVPVPTALPATVGADGVGSRMLELRVRVVLTVVLTF